MSWTSYFLVQEDQLQKPIAGSLEMTQQICEDRPAMADA